MSCCKKKKDPDKKTITLESDIDEHTMSVQELKARFSTKINEKDIKSSIGLTSDEVKQLRIRHGPNILLPPKDKPEIVKFLMQFLNPLLILLMIAGVLSFTAYAINRKEQTNLYLGVALFIFTFVTCLISYDYLNQLI